MNVTAININGQDSPDIAPVKAMERVQTLELRRNENARADQVVNENEEITSDDVKEVLEAFKDLSETIQTKLSFTVHEENNEIVVKVFDKESNELIRQFPSDEMLALQDKMSDLAGFLFDGNA